MKVCVIGSGYVGLVAGAGFAEIGHTVRCVDIDEAKIDSLNRGEIPIYEPGLEDLVVRNREEGRLSFSTQVGEAVAFADVVFIAVGTPEREDGSADVSAVLAVAEVIGRNIRGYTVVACKSTVPVGTNEKVRKAIEPLTDQPFSVASNPEFLREGEAVADFMQPPRVVIGTNDERAEKVLRDLYAPLYGYYDARDRIICMDPRSAEVTKYVANAFLATRITFINEIAGLCEIVGADITKVRIGAGTDPRIGIYYFAPGCGYGGSCFPKDVQALLRTARSYDYDLSILSSVDHTNDKQKVVPFTKVKRALGDLRGKTVAIWGLAFKPGTDDIRESPAIYIVEALLEAGAKVRAHDPVGMANFKRLITEAPTYVEDMYEALDGADALVVVTDWSDYRKADLKRVAEHLEGDVVIDGRNIWSEKPRPGTWRYEGIGLGFL